MRRKSGKETIQQNSGQTKKLKNPLTPPFFKGGQGGILSLLLASLLLCFLLQSTSLAASKQINEKLLQLNAHSGPFTFVVLGDNRSGDRIYQNLIAMAMSRRPDFVVNTGDLIVRPGNREQWKKFWQISSKIQVPYFAVVGNHDVDDKKSETVWKEEVDLPGSELYYSWVVGKSLFVVLDAYEPEHDLRIEARQLDWLTKTLDPKKYEHQFVFVHPPLYLNRGATNYGNSLDKYAEERDRLQRLFKEKKVDAVFMGHEHAYEKRLVDGVWHIITGGGGAPIYDKSYCHFVIVNVDGPRVETKVIDKEGVMRDEFRIR
jgi:predicted phosphodiesterase